MVPGLEVNVVNRNIGQLDVGPDGVCGLITNGVAVAEGISLNTPVVLFSVQDAENIGINAEYDSTHGVEVYKQIEDFYRQSRSGRALWLLVLGQTITLAQMADVANPYVQNLLSTSENTISVIGFKRNPLSSYEPVIENGIDADCSLAVTKAQEQATFLFGHKKYVRMIVEARSLDQNVANVPNFRLTNRSRVSIVATNSTGGVGADVGTLLGRISALPVQRSIAYRKDGALPGIEAAYLASSTPFSKKYQNSGEDSLWHQKGYIMVAPIGDIPGYFFVDDLSCAPNSIDDNSISKGRALDKVLRTVRVAYGPEVNNDVELNENGELSAIEIEGLTAIMNKALRDNLIVPGEISAGSVFIPSGQNVLSTNKIDIEVEFRPKGQTKRIRVNVSFGNAA